MIDRSRPITPAELMSRSEHQLSHDEAALFLRGLSIGVPGNGVAARALKACEGSRHVHPALDRATARRYAEQLAHPFVPRGELETLLQRANGLSAIGDLTLRYTIGIALDDLLVRDRATSAVGQ